MLLINEIFHSIQGEGSKMGRPAIFIRLQGCPIGCGFCDTRYAQRIDSAFQLPDHAPLIWQKAKHTTEYSAFTVAQLYDVLVTLPTKANLVVITGGEPCLQNIGELTNTLIAQGFNVQLETSGCYPLNIADSVWVTLSPKHKPVLHQNWQRANEIKIPVQTEKDVLRYREELAHLCNKPIWLQPLNCDPQATALCVRLCEENNFGLSIQMHKYIDIL